MFIVPVILFCLAIALIDPYNMFESKVFSQEQKKNTAYRLNYALWKYLEFDKNPNPIILLGDSRMALLSNELIDRLTGVSAYNFAYGGGTLPETIQTFWYADKKTNLKKVYIGINLESYNGLKRKNRCKEAGNILNNKGLYFINQSVINSSFLILKNTFTGKNEVVGKPKDKEKFWKKQLETAANVLYKDYTYPVEFYKELEKITEHCNKKGIELSFVILPTHRDLQDQLVLSGKEKELNHFIEDIYSLGKTYNFHKKSMLTRDKELYNDPFHFGVEVREEVIKYIFGLQAMNEEVMEVSTMNDIQ